MAMKNPIFPMLLCIAEEYLKTRIGKASIRIHENMLSLMTCTNDKRI